MTTLEREFDATAHRYDLMVALNPGYHRHLRAAAAELARRVPRDRPLRVVDLGCGSGASTRALVDQLGTEHEILGVDASDGMLDVARGKSWPLGVAFRHGMAEDVAARADDWQVPQPVDAVFAAYLFRNVTDRDEAVEAVFDVVAPGGWLVTQEYSVAGSRRSVALWTLVCWTIVIPLSLVLTGRTRLYRYLWRSVLRFDSVARFERRLRENGFDEVTVTTVEGWRSGPAGWQKGILHTFAATASPAGMSASTWTPGRDRRAVNHPAAPGEAWDAGRHTALVLGGGVAGLSAATALTERGVAVTLVEAHDQLGGRVRSWPVEHDAGQVTMSRGFHAFFRQYYNLRSLLRRTDPTLSRLTPVADYPLVSGAGHRDSFARIPRTPPLNLATFVLQSKTFTLSALRRIDTRAAGELLDVEFPRTFAEHDGESAQQFLDRLRFPSAARHLALEVFARSFFAHPADFSAGELIAMFHSYFLGSAEGLLFDVPDDDYDTALWAPLRRYLTGHGVDVRTGTSALRVVSTTDGVEVDTSAGALRADAVVVATDLATTQRLLTTVSAVRSDDSGWRDRLAAMRQAPPFAVWRLWLDRPARADRGPFLGTAGFGCVDNISVLERFEAGAAEWARRHGGSVVELHAYALAPGTSHEDVRRQMRQVLDRLYPEFAGAGVVADEYLVEADCPLVGTEPWASRPGVETPDARVVLAGDGVRCDYPTALMERAATTGLLAANALLGTWHVAGHDVWSVPLQARTWVARHAGKGARQASSAVRTR